MQSKHDFIVGYALGMQVCELAAGDPTKVVQVLEEIAAGNLTIVPTSSETAQAMRKSSLPSDRKKDIEGQIASLNRSEADNKAIEGAKLMLEVVRGNYAALDD